MKVIEVAAYGGPDTLQLQDRPDPTAGPGQVVVRVTGADVLFLDTHIRGGWGEFFGIAPPYIPGDGVGGVVTAVGPGVAAEWIGRIVVGPTAGAGPQGGYAEQALVRVEELVGVPSGLDPQAALALLHDGATAVRLFGNASVRRCDRVLVTGAAGGLGLLLVQLAVGAGARVIGAARGTAKLDLVREHGAVAVDYSAGDWTRQVRELTGGTGLDVVFDGVGGEIGRAAFGLAVPGARFSAHGTPSGSFAPVSQEDARRRSVVLRGIEQVRFGPAELAEHARQALAEAAAGRLTPVVGQTYPLADAAVAHRALEGRTAIGKTLLRV